MFKKPKKVLSQAEQEISIKKDLFWRLFFLMFFVAGAALMNLSQVKWNNPVFTVIIIIVALCVVILGPGYLYKKDWVQFQYKAFDTKNWNNIENDKDKKQAKLFYNLIIFLVMAMLSGPLAGAIAYFIFNKNNTVHTVLTLVFIALAIGFSIYLTERKSKKEVK